MKYAALIFVIFSGALKAAIPAGATDLVPRTDSPAAESLKMKEESVTTTTYSEVIIIEALTSGHNITCRVKNVSRESILLVLPESRDRVSYSLEFANGGIAGGFWMTIPSSYRVAPLQPGASYDYGEVVLKESPGNEVSPEMIKSIAFTVRMIRAQDLVSAGRNSDASLVASATLKASVMRAPAVPVYSSDPFATSTELPEERK